MTLREGFANWVRSGGRSLGELVLTSDFRTGGWLLTHRRDVPAAGTGSLRRLTGPDAAIGLARFSVDGAFRPLKSAPTLIDGWELALRDLEEVRLAFDGFYPAAVANWIRWCAGEAEAPPLPETLSRQTGIYRLTALLTTPEARSVVSTVCSTGCCLRVLLWKPREGEEWREVPPDRIGAPRELPAGVPHMPLLCTDPCPLFLGEARRVVRHRRRSGPADESPAA